MSAPLNLTVVDPELADLIAQIKKEVMLDFACHAIGTVVTFTPGLVGRRATATIRVNYTKTYYERNLVTGKYSPVPGGIPYPILLDVPVFILGGGATSGLTFPILPGHECMVFFNDRDIDNWFAAAPGSLPVENASGRLHSFSDGIALIGFAQVTGYDLLRVLMFNGLTQVGCSATQVRIRNATISLGTALGNLITAIEGIVTTKCVVNAPVVLNLATITALQAVRVQLAGLLE